MHACIKQAITLLNALPNAHWQGASHAGLRRQGEHPQRRAGIGHDYWEFRPYNSHDAASRIDWKRSARDDTLYVRQLEQEAPRTLALHLDSHASMHYRGTASSFSKYETGLIMALALGGWASQHLETVAVQGLPPRRYDSQHSLMRLFQDFQHTPQDFCRLRPPSAALPSGCHTVLLTDGFHKEALLHAYGRAGQGGDRKTAIVLIHDTDEVTFPFQGRRTFQDDSADTHTLGKSEQLQAAYQYQYEAWRAALVTTLTALQAPVWCVRADTELAPVLTAMVEALHAR